MFTLLVEAKDHGEVVSLSSSTTVAIHVQDGNDHLPTFTGQTGTGKVKEGEIGSSPLRLHVADEDTPKSPAWRARYTIQGDKGGHFEIKTDPDTNDGILTVVKPLDFEEGAQRELSISVENEVPYFSCKVKERTSSGLWTVDTSTSDDSHTGQGPSVKIIVEVEDVNDPPVFAVTVKEAVLKENSPIGTWVEKVTAVDPDSSHARDFLYKVAHDPSGWVTVDPNTGDITTVKSPDRESPHVVNGVYSILLYAVDKGEPPLTGTSTLQIHVTDLNDNLPQMTTDYLDVCMSSSVTNITAFDLDENPFGGPFKFELLGDVKGKWKLNPSYGYTAGLVKQPGVYAGPYTINVKISDLQGEFGVYNLSVTVCNCSVTPTCRTQRKTATKAASGAIGIVFASLLLLLFLLLTSVVISRNKKEFIIGQISEASGETLLASNIETPGTDCKMPDCFLKPPAASSEKYQDSSKWQTLNAVRQTFPTKYQQDMKNTAYENYGDYRRDVFYGFNDNWNQENMLSLEQEDMSTMNYLYKREASHVTDATVLALLHWRLSSLQETEDDLDYQPHPYAEEGNFDDHFELENITIPDEDESFQKVLRDLGSKFNQLALICKPVDGEN
uniref:Cadherin domain-containing protein n=1 Tax=Anabas testudineus TaxID=64144 RepID=A0AAQ6I8L3_ANATE